MRNGILAGGNWIMDHVKVVDQWPTQDTLSSILRQWSGNGGSPYNILVNLSRLGSPFPLAGIGLVGEDDNGRAILADCSTHQIDTSQLRMTQAAATSYTDVMTVESTGRRTFFHQRGANALLDVDHFNFRASQARLFHLGYILLLDRLDQLVDGKPRACAVLEQARAAGLQTSLDCVSENGDRFQSIVAPALPYVDILFANDFETEKLTGIELRINQEINPLAVGQAARQLLKRGVRTWVVIHFPEAVYACDASGHGIWQPSLRVAPSEIAGAAGAGDALAAGVLLGVHENWSMADSLRLGVSAAAASLFHPTCSGGVQPVADCLALAQRLGFNSLP